jgi:uncharacterized membrane protein
MDKGRLEAFSDGVIAILITIMVLELTTPQGNTLSALMQDASMLLGYAISYFYLGIYWVNHHRMLSKVDEVCNSALWSNLVLLFFMSLIPFATGWVIQERYAPEPTLFYCLVLLVVAFMFQVTSASVNRMPHPFAAACSAIVHEPLAGFSVGGLIIASVCTLLAPVASYVLIVATVLPWVSTKATKSETK